MTLSEQQFIINAFRIKSTFHELDAKLSTGDYELPEQWPSIPDLDVDVI